jgi:hypothetical protein
MDCYTVLAAVSHRYPELKGRSSTRYSPVRRSTHRPKSTFSHDLHVLSTSPAFNLSQDQTLQFEILVLLKPNQLSLEGYGYQLINPTRYLIVKDLARLRDASTFCFPSARRGILSLSSLPRQQLSSSFFLGARFPAAHHAVGRAYLCGTSPWVKRFSIFFPTFLHHPTMTMENQNAVHLIRWRAHPHPQQEDMRRARLFFLTRVCRN